MKVSVTISGAGMTRQGRSQRGPGALAREAACPALRDAVLEPAQIAMVLVGNAIGGLLSDQGSVRGQAWLHTLRLGNAPVVSVENGCASAASALRVGCLAVQSGLSPVFVVGVEKMWTGDRAATHADIEHSLVADQRDALRAELGNRSGRVFMGLNWAWAAHQMAERGTTVDAEELYALESLGFHELGQAGTATLAGETSLGRPGMVVNPSGGLVARGHPIGASGLCQAYELAQRLQGRAGDRAASGARVGVSLNTGGIINRDVAYVGVHVLAAG